MTFNNSEAYEPEPDEEPQSVAGHRTYEVYQRERVGKTTNLIKPIQLLSSDYLRDPNPLLEILRENYPCYRDWVGNRFWITRYDDVTSILADNANYELRPKLWRYGGQLSGRNLAHHLEVQWAWSKRLDDGLERVIDRVVGELMGRDQPDLATDFAARLPLELMGEVLGLPPTDLPEFASRYWRMQRGASWDPKSQADGVAAAAELVRYFEPLLERRRAEPREDLVSAVAGLAVPGNATSTSTATATATSTRAEDLVVTLLEADHETLHGALANLWFQLLTNAEQFEVVRSNQRMVKFAYLETLRHSPPVLSASRYTRHEVERFGRLLPEGALVYCSVAAANRDPRQFAEPDRFVVDRSDLCQREPRGQFRADGLPAAIAPGLGLPSKHPAVPKDRPRSVYAQTRDIATAASTALLEALPNMSLAKGSTPEQSTPNIEGLRLGDMRTCWNLPVTFSRS